VQGISLVLRRLAPQVVAIFALLSLAACARGPKPGPTPGPAAPSAAPRIIIDKELLTLPSMAAEGREPTRIGFLVPLTGPDAATGKALLDAAQLAIFESGRRDLLLLPEDTGASPEAAAEAAQKVLKAGAEIILGPLRADEVDAVASYGLGTDTPIVAFSSNTASAKPGIYLLSFPPELEVVRIVDFAVMSGFSRFAALIPDGNYGTIVEEAYRDAVAAHHASLVSVSHYGPTLSEMFQPARDLAHSGGFDAVLLPEGGTNLRALAPLLPYSGVDTRSVKILGTGLWDEPNLGREPALVHGWFAAPPPEARQKFIQRFTAAYGRTPPRIASIGYDAVALAASLADAPPGERFTPDRLTNPNGFSGIDGLFRFEPDGHIERGLAVNEVLTDGVAAVSPAPTSFVSPGF
jgi:ABC-type branched-subunit amino acid transport system substrate-binding protein